MTCNLFNLEINEYQKEAFWSKVDVLENTSLCWEWKGAKKTKGYGNCRINNKYYIAHRIAFWLVNGDFPCNFVVCHTCDNPSCCNPHHLMLGSQKSNFMDLLIKTRKHQINTSLFGSNNINSKLTENDVKEIRTLYSTNKANQKELADKYNVTPSTIGSIVRNESWRHVA